MDGSTTDRPLQFILIPTYLCMRCVVGRRRHSLASSVPLWSVVLNLHILCLWFKLSICKVRQGFSLLFLSLDSFSTL